MFISSRVHSKRVQFTQVYRFLCMPREVMIVSENESYILKNGTVRLHRQLQVQIKSNVDYLRSLLPFICIRQLFGIQEIPRSKRDQMLRFSGKFSLEYFRTFSYKAELIIS